MNKGTIMEGESWTPELLMEEVEKLRQEIEILRKMNEQLNYMEQSARVRNNTEYGRGVSAGKAEALKYTPEERENYGRWVAENDDFQYLKKKLKAAHTVCLAIHSHYSGSLDYQPPYVRMARMIVDEEKLES